MPVRPRSSEVFHPAESCGHGEERGIDPAFEKAGFKYLRTNEDGDAMDYVFNK